MSEHAWSQEHVAAFVAGGLTAAEAERLEAHARDCPECAAALAAARRLDRGLDGLFADVRPGPALEDRVIWSLRVSPAVRRRKPLMAGWARRTAVAVAAVLILGTFGALAGSLINGDVLPLPGAVREAQASRITREGTDRASTTAASADGMVRPAGAPAVDSARRSMGVHNLSSVNGTAAAPPGMPPGGGFNGGVQTYGGGIQGGIGGFGGGIAGFGGSPGGGPGGPVGTREAQPFRPTDSIVPPGFGDAAGAEDSKGKKPGAWSLHYFRPDEQKPALPQQGQQGGGKDDKYAPAPKAEPKPGEQTAPSPSRADPAAQTPPAKNPPPAPEPEPGPRRVVIRSGDIEFEVDSFDAAAATVTKLVAGIKGAFVATVNSDKLPNGKVKGSITVRVPPESLDGLVLDLRKELGKGGELKGLRIGSQDVTKQYTDLESRLRGARTMEQRLLQIIKEGKGEIKQLLEAEKELGVWRTRIEEFEGELRYYSNLAALSTLTITLAEKEIRAAAGITESERVQAGIEVEDVDQAYRQALAAVTAAKGRVTRSELKQLAAGQFNATLNFEVAPDAAGPLRDRLRQLGTVARLEIDRVQQAEGGTLPSDAKVKRGDTQFFVQFYNLANVQPRETTTLTLAAPDVPAAYRALREAVAAVNGRVATAQLNEQDRQNVTAQFNFEVRRADEAAVQRALAAAGEVVARQATRAPEGATVTDAKVLYQVALLPAARLRPRETTTLSVEVADVDGSAAVFAAQVGEAGGRQVDAKVDHERAGRVTAHLVYEVPLAAAAGLVERVKSAGTVRAQQTARDPQAPDGKYATARVDVTLSNADLIVAKDDGLWPQVRRGLSYSASVLLTSVTWVVFGLCVVLPWAVVGYLAYRLLRRLFRPTPPPAPAPVPANG